MRVLHKIYFLLLLCIAVLEFVEDRWGRYSPWKARDTKDVVSDVVMICHPEWFGIRAATNQIGLYVYERKGFKSTSKQQELIDFVSSHNTSAVVFNGIPPGSFEMARILRRTFGNDLFISMTFHAGPAYQPKNDPSVDYVVSLSKLVLNGILDSVGLVKESFGNWFNSNVHPNMKKVTNFKRRFYALNGKFSAIDGKTHIGIFGKNSELKNVVTQITAACMLDNSFVIHTVSRGSDIMPYISEYCKPRIIAHGEKERFISHFEAMSLASSMDINIYVSFTEAHPMVNLESIASGVPCIASDSSAIYDDFPDLRRQLVVRKFDDIQQVFASIKGVAENLTALTDAQEIILHNTNKRAHSLWSDLVKHNVSMVPDGNGISSGRRMPRGSCLVIAEKYPLDNMQNEMLSFMMHKCRRIIQHACDSGTKSIDELLESETISRVYILSMGMCSQDIVQKVLNFYGNDAPFIGTLIADVSQHMNTVVSSLVETSDESWKSEYSFQNVAERFTLVASDAVFVPAQGISNLLSKFYGENVGPYIVLPMFNKGKQRKFKRSADDLVKSNTFLVAWDSQFSSDVEIVLKAGLKYVENVDRQARFVFIGNISKTKFKSVLEKTVPIDTMGLFESSSESSKDIPARAVILPNKFPVRLQSIYAALKQNLPVIASDNEIHKEILDGRGVSYFETSDDAVENLFVSLKQTSNVDVLKQLEESNFGIDIKASKLEHELSEKRWEVLSNLEKVMTYLNERQQGKDPEPFF